MDEKQKKAIQVLSELRFDRKVLTDDEYYTILEFIVQKNETIVQNPIQYPNPLTYPWVTYGVDIQYKQNTDDVR